MAIFDSMCEKCQHSIVCSIKEKSLDKFAIEEGEKKYLGVDVTMMSCKSFNIFINEENEE